jgi:hypothetical protein
LAGRAAGPGHQTIFHLVLARVFSDNSRAKGKRMAYMSKMMTYGVVVTMNEDEARAVAERIPGAGSTDQKLGSVAAGLMRDLSKGGVMLAPEWAERIQTAIGTTDPQSIVEHVEKAVAKRGDATVVEWVVDPTQVQFYQELADSTGLSLDVQLKSTMDFAYAQGWFNTSAPDPFKLLLTDGQYRALQAMFAKDVVTGEDIVRRLNVVTESSTTADDAFLMDSLKG